MVEFVADLVCPWCYIGKRRFERALQMRPQHPARVAYRSFLVHGARARDELSFGLYLGRPCAGMREISVALDKLYAAGEEENITFRLPRCLPSAVHAHRLLHWARRRGCESMMMDQLFKAYHETGVDIGDLEALAEIAAAIGFERQEARDFLAGSDLRSNVQSEHSSIQARGLTGVPCVIVDGRFAMAGAQEPEFYLPILDLARQQSKLLLAAE